MHELLTAAVLGSAVGSTLTWLLLRRRLRTMRRMIMRDEFADLYRNYRNYRSHSRSAAISIDGPVRNEKSNALAAYAKEHRGSMANL